MTTAATAQRPVPWSGNLTSEQMDRWFRAADAEQMALLSKHRVCYRSNRHLLPVVARPMPEPEFVIDWNAIRPRGYVSSICRPWRISAATVFDVCTRLGNLSRDDMTGYRRAKPIATWRAVAAYIAATHCRHLSLSQIGKALGGRDHTTVIHGRNRVREDLAGGGEIFGEMVAAVEHELGLR